MEESSLVCGLVFTIKLAHKKSHQVESRDRWQSCITDAGPVPYLRRVSLIDFVFNLTDYAAHVVAAVWADYVSWDRRTAIRTNGQSLGS